MWDTSQDPEPAEPSTVSTCSWPIIPHCTLDIDPDIQTAADQAAIEILHAATGRQFGLCVGTWQPCRKRCTNALPDRNMWDLVDPYRQFGTSLANDVWFAYMNCGRCGSDDCACVELTDLTLWHRHVTDIIQVQVDGDILDPSAYRLWRNRLLRLDGDPWPECNDPTVPNGDPGTWSITYRYGRAVPYGGRLAAGQLSCEIAKAYTGDSSCALPRRVQTVTRQGVTIGFIDPMDFLDKGLTGLPLVDMWITSVNPHRIRRRARAYRADGRRQRPTGAPGGPLTP